VFAECLEGIAQAANQAGYAILPMTTDYLEPEELAVQRLWSEMSMGWSW
jgi:DNA-binding LacI/PurR family transcriptional regulator